MRMANAEVDYILDTMRIASGGMKAELTVEQYTGRIILYLTDPATSLCWKRHIDLLLIEEELHAPTDEMAKMIRFMQGEGARSHQRDFGDIAHVAYVFASHRKRDKTPSEADGEDQPGSPCSGGLYPRKRQHYSSG